MRGTIVAGCLVALVAAGVLTGARPKPITATVTPRPASIEQGQPWVVTIRLRRSGKPYAATRPVLTATLGRLTRSQRATPARPAGTFRARLVLPRVGRWTYVVRVAGAPVVRGSVVVRARPPRPDDDVQEPFAVALAPSGEVLVADRAAHRVVAVTPGSTAVRVVAGNGQPGFSGDGAAATQAAVGEPIDVHAGANGDVYIVTGARVRKVDTASGTITTIAGTGERAFSGDGGPAAAAALNAPDSVATDAAGNVYIAEYENRVRRIDAATLIITTAAGTGAEASSGDGGPARQAAIMHPHGLAVTPEGTLYIADTWAHRIRRVDAATQVITTVAGSGQEGFGGDAGPATQAFLNDPVHVALGPGGSLYVSDGSNNRIRRFTVGGAITTVAGNGIESSAGDGAAATRASLALPNQVAVAPDGTFYIAEFSGRSVRRVDGATGVITTVAR